MNHEDAIELNRTGIDPIATARRFQTLGHMLLRYGLVFILLLIGLQKFTSAEAQGIQNWMSHSPFLSWLYSVTSLQGASDAIGVAELVTAVLIAVRRWSPRLAALGSLLAIFTFLTTLSFLLTTPNPSAADQGFLIKDIFLLGAAVWSFGESFEAALAKWVPGAR